MDLLRKFNTITIALLALVFILTISTIYFYIQAKEVDSLKALILRDYDDLEEAYTKALVDIEGVSTNNYDNMVHLKQDLRSKLSRIQEIKAVLVENRGKTDDYIELDDVMAQLDLEGEDTTRYADAENPDGSVIYENPSNEVIYDEEEVGQIIVMNDELRKQNEEMEKNLATIRKYFEREKSKNEKLNAAISLVNDQLKRAEDQGYASKEELNKLKVEKEKIVVKLQESNDIIEKQNDQIGVLVETLRKANVDVFFIYEKGNAEKEAKIYLTSEGVSKVYLDYFLRKKPDLHIAFKLNKDLFDAGVEKVHMSIYDSKNNPIFALDKTINSTDLNFEIEGTSFPIDSYYITLRNGPEDLIIGGQYENY